MKHFLAVLGVGLLIILLCGSMVSLVKLFPIKQQVGTDEPTHVHYFESTVVNPATCTLYGSARYECACGETHFRAITPLGHVEKYHAAVAATYETEGLTEGKYCTRCKLWLVPQTVIPVLTDSIFPNGDYAENDVTTETYLGWRANTCIADGLLRYDETVSSLDDGTGSLALDGPENVAIYKAFTAEIGKTYKVSFWAKTKDLETIGGAASCYFMIASGLDAVNDPTLVLSTISHLHNVGEEWTEYTATFTATEETCYFFMKMYGFISGTLWVDNVVVYDAAKTLAK